MSAARADGDAAGTEWRPWAELAVGAAVIAACCLFVFLELQPALIFRNTTPNGGDTGAHVWWPAFFSDTIFPSWRLSGWAPDWYAGFPAGHFYFPLPVLLIWFVDLVLPYNVAFKLVAAAGPIMLPGAAYAFARGIRARWPAPPLFAVAAVVFLFDLKYQNFGGNLTSTLQGEFSFSMGIAFGLFFLAAYARALRNRKGFALAAALLAATLLCHVIVAVLVVVGAIVVWLGSKPLRTFLPAVSIAVVGGLLTAVWSLPLVGRLAYTTDMGWQKVTAYVQHLFPSDIIWVVALAGIGAVTGLVLVRRASLLLLALTVAFGLLFVVAPEGRLWNARVLPFYYVFLFLLAAQGGAEVARAAGRGAAKVWARVAGPLGEADLETAPVEDDATLLPSRGETTRPAAPEPESRSVAESEPSVTLRWGAATTLAVLAVVAGLVWAHVDRGYLDDWARWNSSGYEARTAYPEYAEIIETMNGLEPGRAVWERAEGLNNYGTDLALELLPYFTDGRIASMEGLYFESSATTPYHFLMVAKLGSEPSNPVRFDDDSGITYSTIDSFDEGVRQLQAFGVRYLMLTSDAAQERADANPNLELVAEVGDRDGAPPDGWRIYEVADSELVEPLRYEPVVLDDVDAKAWLEPSARWWEDPAAIDRPLAAGGPETWARASADDATNVPFSELPPVEVTDIETDRDEIRFHVSEPGVPVVVKISYFPGWSAEGAEGPWRLTPNLMVVVPTAETVTLSYGATALDYAGLALTGVGFVGLGLLAWWARRRSRSGGSIAGETPVETAATRGSEEVPALH